MLLDSTLFPDLVDGILRAADLEGLCTWRSVSRYHRAAADRLIFAHVHLYERAAYDVHGAALGGWAICARGRRWPYWAWARDGSPRDAVDAALSKLWAITSVEDDNTGPPSPTLPPPFTHTRTLDISWQGSSSPQPPPVPAHLLRLFDPSTVRLVAFRGAYPPVEWVWPSARLIAFADVSTTRQRGGRDTQLPGPRTSTTIHLQYDARRNEFFRLLALSYVFPPFKPTHDTTIIVSADRPGPEALLDRKKTTAQVLKRVGYWIAYGSGGEWNSEEYRITVVVEGAADLGDDKMADEVRASAVRAVAVDGADDDDDVNAENAARASRVPPMPVTFVSHHEYRAQLGDAGLQYDWPRQPGERMTRRGSGTLWVL